MFSIIQSLNWKLKMVRVRLSKECYPKQRFTGFKWSPSHLFPYLDNSLPGPLPPLDPRLCDSAPSPSFRPWPASKSGSPIMRSPPIFRLNKSEKCNFNINFVFININKRFKITKVHQSRQRFRYRYCTLKWWNIENHII